MDKTALVRSDRDIGGLVLEALSRAKIPVRLCDWHHVPDIDEWELIIATPWYDARGPREANSRVIKALQDAGIYQDVPILRLSVRSPGDAVVKAIEQELKDRKQGTIHIVDLGGPNGRKEYSVIFAPYTGKGGAVPSKRLSGLEQLREFLEKRLHIWRSSVDEALAELDRKGNASISQVQLTTREAKKLGLA